MTDLINRMRLLAATYSNADHRAVLITKAADEIERLGKELKYSALAATAEAHEADRLQGELARVQTISDNYYALVVELNAREAKLREASEAIARLVRS